MSVEQRGDCVSIGGGMTFAEASALVDGGLPLLTATETVFDLAAVEEVDSASLAVIFAWLRAARARQGSIRVVNPPANLVSLAELYGVAELMPLAAPGP